MGSFNVGTNESYKNLDVIKEICKILKKKPNKYIKFIKDRPFNDKRYFLNLKKISSIGWKAKENFFRDLPEIVSWYKKNYKIFDEKIYNQINFILNSNEKIFFCFFLF